MTRIKLSDEITYFGNSRRKDNHDEPHGYGVILSNWEIFAGEFKKGLLSGFGQIRFENGTTYFG